MLMQCGAAIYQKCPKSAIFRLPALANADVIGWMKTTFPTQLCLLQAKAGSPVDLARIQNDSLRHALEEVRNIMTSQLIELAKLRTTVERRTAVLSPAQGFSASTYHRTCTSMALSHFIFLISPSCCIFADTSSARISGHYPFGCKL